MSSDWKKSAELVIDTIADAIHLVILVIIPTPATSRHTPEKVRALQLSALFVITILGIWLISSMEAGIRTKFEAVPFILLSAVYFTLASWLTFGVLRASGQYLKNGETISDALALVIGFCLITLLGAVFVKQLDVFVGLNVKHDMLNKIAFAGSISFAALVTIFRTWWISPPSSLLNACKSLAVILVLVLTSAIYSFALIFGF